VKLLVRWIIVAVALVAAVALIPGIRVEDTNAWIAAGVMAAVLGLVNAFLRPFLAFLYRIPCSLDGSGRKAGRAALARAADSALHMHTMS
jgi:uncharacterized membrane protein YvlD (DUF360 family)